MLSPLSAAVLGATLPVRDDGGYGGVRITVRAQDQGILTNVYSEQPYVIGNTANKYHSSGILQYDVD
jgi:hypothetical protein